MKSTRDSPCQDAGFGYENGDGYVRIWDKPKSDGGKLVMRHRWFWEHHKGEIPKGCEVNHLCKNRRCFNVGHLEVLSVTEHRAKDNSEGYESEYETFKKWFTEERVGHYSQRLMGEMFNRTQSGVCLWVKRLRKETKLSLKQN